MNGLYDTVYQCILMNVETAMWLLLSPVMWTGSMLQYVSAYYHSYIYVH